MAGVSTVQVQPVGKLAPSKGAAAPAKAAEPRMAGDRVTLSKRQPFADAAHDMRKGIFEVAGGAGLLAAGAVGVALTASAPIWAPIACAAVAVGGAALAVKGINDYGKGIAELLVDVILLPFHIADAFRPKE